jgi:hypothetical protein
MVSLDPISILLIITIGFVAFTVFILATAADALQTTVEERRNRKRFYAALRSGLKVGSISTTVDVTSAYEAITGLRSQDFGYHARLSRWLQWFWLGVVSNDKDFLPEGVDQKTAVNWKQKVSEFIDSQKAMLPFENLPEIERKILLDITKAIDAGDKEFAKSEILELTGAIRFKADELKKSQTINKWTVFLTAVGVILGILSLIK